MLVTVKEFNAYSGDYEGDEEITAKEGETPQKSEVTLLKEQMLESAQNMVADFLRFDPENHVWSEVPEQNVCPPLVLLTIKKIATLLLMEAGENIGITGKSMPDNSRTFINYTGYMKYLRPIQSYREVVF